MGWCELLVYWGWDKVKKESRGDAQHSSAWSTTEIYNNTFWGNIDGKFLLASTQENCRVAPILSELVAHKGSRQASREGKAASFYISAARRLRNTVLRHRPSYWSKADASFCGLQTTCDRGGRKFRFHSKQAKPLVNLSRTKRTAANL